MQRLQSGPSTPSPRAGVLLLALVPAPVLILGLTLGLAGCSEPPTSQLSESPLAESPPELPSGSPAFVDASSAAGLDFVHFNGMSGQLYLAEITCGGVALLDADGDGDLDVYFPQGRMLPPGAPLTEATVPPRHPTPLTDRLYRNDLGTVDGAEPAALRFTDVTASSGLAATLADAAYGCSVATGDFDRDGDVDLFVGRLGPDTLLANRGDGTFEDVTADAGLRTEGMDHSSSVVALFFDFDRDGDLDLFVGNNMAFDYGETVCTSLTGARDYCGPGAYPSQPDRLWQNRGDGTFEEITAHAGLAAAPLRPTLGAVAGDFDGDGWLDLYVANDGQPNNLWRNRGDGTFEDVALLAGAALNATGQAEASMGVDAEDLDADGDLDLFLTHLVKETNTLYANDGGGSFTDRTAAAGLAAPSLPFTGFGASFLDVDLNGRLDLLVVNGAVTLVPEQVRRGDPFPLHQADQLFTGQRSSEESEPGAMGRFRDTSAEAGPAVTISKVSRGLAVGDLDNDGDPDAVVVDLAAPARLLLNQAGDEAARRGAWVGLRVLDRARNGSPPRDALGARVGLLRGGHVVAWRRVATDGSYASARDPRVVFALGDDPTYDGFRVRWPDGVREDFPPLPAGAYGVIEREGPL